MGSNVIMVKMRLKVFFIEVRCKIFCFVLLMNKVFYNAGFFFVFGVLVVLGGFCRFVLYLV